MTALTVPLGIAPSRSALPITVTPQPSAAATGGLAPAAPESSFDGTISAANASDKNAIARLTAAPFWAAADVPTRQLVWALARASVAANPAESKAQQSRALLLLAALAESGKLADKASDGRTLLQILVSTRVCPAVGAVAPMSPAMMSNIVMEELAHPAIVTQGKAHDCGITALQLGLMRTNPAEYARLVVGIFAEGAVRLRNGQTLHFDANSSKPYDGDTRTATSRALQSALMQFSKPTLDYIGGAEPASFVGVRTISKLPLWGQLLLWIGLAPVALLLWLSRENADGVIDTELVSTASALFGEAYKQYGSDQGAARSAWLAQFLARKQPVVAGVYWPEAKKGHQLQVIGVAGLRVMLRDPAAPYGNSEDGTKNGMMLKHEPGVTLIDAAQGVVSVMLGDPRIDLTFFAPAPAPLHG